MKEYKVKDDKEKTLKVFTNLREAKKFAKQKAIELVDRVFVDLYSDEYGIYQLEDTMAVFDPMGNVNY